MMGWETRVRETSNPKFISIRGGACSDSASVASFFSRSQNSGPSVQPKPALQTSSFRPETSSAVDISVYEDSRIILFSWLLE